MAAIDCGGIGTTGVATWEGAAPGNAEVGEEGSAPTAGAVSVSSGRTTRLRGGMMSAAIRTNRSL